MTDLCRIMSKYGSDKCSDWHNYTPLYYDLFKDIRNEYLNIFELGILFGYSLRAWQEFFPNARIYAGDIDTKLFVNEDRIQSFYCDQDSIVSVRQLWDNPELRETEFDIIIDDGKHEFHSNLTFFSGSIHKLKKGGFYIIEDLTHSGLYEAEQALPELKREFEEASILEIDSKTNKIDNNLLIIKK